MYFIYGRIRVSLDSVTDLLLLLTSLVRVSCENNRFLETCVYHNTCQIKREDDLVRGAKRLDGKVCNLLLSFYISYNLEQRWTMQLK